MAGGLDVYILHHFVLVFAVPPAIIRLLQSATDSGSHPAGDRPLTG